jgi:hypothetical protein
LRPRQRCSSAVFSPDQACDAAPVRCELLGTASESALRVTSDWPSKAAHRAADDSSQAKREGCRAHCRGRDALSRRQGYRSQETVLIALCNESTRSINVARSGAPKYLAERLIGTVRRECLDRLLIFGESPPPQLNGRSLRHFHAQPAQAGSPYVCRLQQPRPRMILEYLGIADRHSQRPPGSYAERPWDELPECSGSIHHLRD